jgi:lipopolysaccharide biosynthesis glycosyltransferase
MSIGKNNKLTIVFAADEKYLKHLAVAIVSLLENNKNLILNIHLIHNGINQKKLDKLNRLVAKYNSKLIFLEIDDNNVKNLYTSSYITTAAYYRLFVASFAEDDVAIYLDCDLIVNGSIQEISNIELNGSYLGAVVDPGINVSHKIQLGMKESSEYFNSGVMLLNLKRWKQENLTRKIIKFIDEKRDIIKYHDQDGLNAIVDGAYVRLPTKYNLQTKFIIKHNKNSEEFKSLNDLSDAIKNPTIIHFTGENKPWHFLSDHPYRKLYKYYQSMTPFRPIFPEAIVKGSIRKLKVTIKKILIVTP